ncbi:UNKNOWN [Stylonychia lemnae]|uniref:Uncharacterized protein n=1 Tax=Stylonychia lemnae TaxID=5949 RepID=A0A078APD7_STYLE|nr:UNKNOWN [Stylonychia lemnae]|eukprot:CDW83811.1 UNKNOWN [Stylonychia lemnae]
MKHKQNLRDQQQSQAVQKQKEDDAYKIELDKLISLKQDIISSVNDIKQDIRKYESEFKGQFENLSKITLQQRVEKKKLQRKLNNISQEYDGIKSKNLDMQIKLATIHRKLQQQENQIYKNASPTKDEQVQSEFGNDNASTQGRNFENIEYFSSSKLEPYDREYNANHSFKAPSSFIQVSDQYQNIERNSSTFSQYYDNSLSKNISQNLDERDRYYKEQLQKAKLFKSPQIRLKANKLIDDASLISQSTELSQSLNQRFQSAIGKNRNQISYSDLQKQLSGDYYRQHYY